MATLLTAHVSAPPCPRLCVCSSTQWITELPGWKFQGLVAAIAPGCVTWTELMPLDNNHFIALKGKGTVAKQEV